MICRQCQTHAVRIAELEEELAAWKGDARDEAANQARLLRMDQWRQVFGMTAARTLTLMEFADHPGRLLSRRAVLLASRRAPDERSRRDPDDLGSKVAEVYVCQVRAMLKARGLGQIETVYGCGWRMPVAVAAAVKVAAGEAQP